MSCGLDYCTCHLRSLNVDMNALEAQIIATEDARHSARDVLVKTMKAWDDARFVKQIADENMEEAKWETGLISNTEWNAEMRGLNDRVTEATVAEVAAREAYEAAREAADTLFQRLMELKKARITS